MGLSANHRALMALTAAINREGPTPDLLKKAVLLLITEVTALHRELDRVSSIASRAESQSRRIVTYR